MSREKIDYRAILEDILQFTGGRRVLTLREVAKYTGLSVPTAKKRYGIGAEGVTAPALAMAMAGTIKAVRR